MARKPQPLIQISVRTEKLRDNLNERIKHLERADEALEIAHERSIEWLGRRALANLTPRIRRDRDERNTNGGLRSLLINPDASTWDAHGFRFMDPKKVAMVAGRTADYYRVIEGRKNSDVGSRYWVNRTLTKPLYMRFFGSPAFPTFEGPQTMAGVGGREALEGGHRDGGMVRFHNPIPAYHYASNAFDTFRQGRQYQTFVYAELRRVGIPVAPGRK